MREWNGPSRVFTWVSTQRVQRIQGFASGFGIWNLTNVHTNNQACIEWKVGCVERMST